MKLWALHWGPTGKSLGLVLATTARAARRKAPKPYLNLRYLGEIGVTLVPTQQTVATKEEGT